MSKTSQTEILELLGLDDGELIWQKLAMCSTMDTEMFYDDYEKNTSIAKNVDDICLSCPVLEQCLKWGIENRQYGVWGGVYLSNGKKDDDRNMHKSEATWDAIWSRLND